MLVDTEVALTTELLAEGADDTDEIGALREGGDATSSLAGKGADIGAAAVVAPANPAPIAEPGRTSRAKPRTHPAKCPLRPPARWGLSGWRSPETTSKHRPTMMRSQAIHATASRRKSARRAGPLTSNTPLRDQRETVTAPSTVGTAKPTTTTTARPARTARNFDCSGLITSDRADLLDRPLPSSPGSAVTWALRPVALESARRPGRDWSPSRADSGPSGPPPDSA